MITEWRKAIMRINQIVRRQKEQGERGEVLFLVTVDIDTEQMTIAVLKREKLTRTAV